MDFLHPAQGADDVAGLGDGFGLVARKVVRYARDRRVHFGAAQRFPVDDLLDRGLDDLRAAEMHAAVAGGHHHLVRQRRDVGATCGAFAEHGRYLRNALSRHPALPVERAAKMILIGKHFIALRQVGAAAIDQIDHRQAVLESDILGADVLADGLLVERAALGGGIVGDDHADHAADGSDAGDDPGRGHRIVVEPPCRERREFEERAERINQHVDTVAGRNLAALAMAHHHALAAAGQRPGLTLMQRLDQAIVNRGVGLVGFRTLVDRTCQCRHEKLFRMSRSSVDCVST